VASHQSENGSISTASSAVSLESEKAAYEFLAQTPVRSTDAHLVEFSEAMRSKDRHSFYFDWSLKCSTKIQNTNLPFTIKILIVINLCDFEAVAKALRRVAEGKAAAQSEAAEWKRKYELETAHKQHSKIKGEICAFAIDDFTSSETIS